MTLISMNDGGDVHEAPNEPKETVLQKAMSVGSMNLTPSKF
jgi:hypothetical protein